MSPWGGGGGGRYIGISLSVHRSISIYLSIRLCIKVVQDKVFNHFIPMIQGLTPFELSFVRQVTRFCQRSDDGIKVPLAAIWNDVCLQNTSKSHSYHHKIWHLVWLYG